jgi:hypothetical protein
MVASIALVRAVSLIETRFANSTNVVDSNLHKITECQNNVLRSDQKAAIRTQLNSMQPLFFVFHKKSLPMHLNTTFLQFAIFYNQVHGIEY